MSTRPSLFFRNETQKYTLIGISFGLLFPAIATIIRLLHSGEAFGLSNIILLHLNDPLIWIIDTAPLFLGLFASVAGRRQDNLLELNNELQLRESQLASTQTVLENRVSERTKTLERRNFELENIAEVVREISVIRNPDTLINLSANLIRERFKYYHTCIFLVDERGEQAVLQAASGSAAQQLLDQGARIKLTEINPLAVALRAGKPYQAADVNRDEFLGAGPLPPEVVSRILLPIRSKNVTRGVLDIHTDQPTLFDEPEIRALQLFADQLATMIENTRLMQEAEINLMELNKLNRVQTQKIWQAAIDEHASSFEYDGHQVRPIPRNLPAEFMDRLQSGRSVVVDETGGSETTRKTLLVPLMILNQLIGVVGLEQDNPAHSWSEEEIAIAEATANRAALTLENARLLEESQRRAFRERTISEASARIGAALNVENILDITAEEIDRVLGSTEVILQINTENRPSTPRMVSD